jgi:hypothetical protein
MKINNNLKNKTNMKTKKKVLFISALIGAAVATLVIERKKVSETVGPKINPILDKVKNKCHFGKAPEQTTVNAAPQQNRPHQQYDGGNRGREFNGKH